MVRKIYKGSSVKLLPKNNTLNENAEEAGSNAGEYSQASFSLNETDI